MVRPAADPEIVWELKPGLRTWHKLARFETNAEGLRDRARSVAKPPGTFRVAVVGDSFTMGSGVALAETYHARLERTLNATRPERRWELADFGVGGSIPSTGIRTPPRMRSSRARSWRGCGPTACCPS
jgi:hypothetical protein